MGKGHSHHAHAPHGDCSHGHKPTEALKKALLVTSFFMIVEFIGGWFANSLALMTDAAHMLTDVGALALSLLTAWVAQRPSNPQMSFGYHRAEILGALFSGLVIWFLSGFLIFEAVLRLSSPPEVQGPLLFGIAVVGFLVNLYSVFTLHGSKADNLNVRAAYLHVIGDMLGSIGAIVAGIVIWQTGWSRIDSIVTIFISVLVLWSAWKLVVEAVGVLMESTPKGVNAQVVQEDLKKVPGVQAIHDLHIWSVSSGKLSLSVHLISAEGEQALQQAKQVLKEKHGISHTTIQVEHPERFDSAQCFDCASEYLETPERGHSW